MKFLHFILINVCILLSQLSFGQVKVQSFYFEQNSSRFTDSSLLDLKRFKEMQQRDYVQIIEVNGFIESTASGGSKLSRMRIDTFLVLTNSDPEPITIRPLGVKREKIYFNVKNWDRIDVYFFYEVIDTADTNITAKIDTNYVEDFSFPKDQDLIEAKEEFGVPVVLPIKFKGGTNKVLPESKPYLDDLADSLQKNTFLYAHIRGHVCCGNNMRISEKRAKVVYKYLLKKGVAQFRLTYKGYSNTLPIVDPERTQEDRATNRRVDVIFTNGEPYVVPEEEK